MRLLTDLSPGYLCITIMSAAFNHVYPCKPSPDRMHRQLQQWCMKQTQILTDWLTSRGAVRSARWRPAPVQHFSAVHALRSRPGTDHGAVDAYCNSLVLHLLFGSRSVRVPQQILNVERRSSRQRSQLRSRRFIVKHFDSVGPLPGWSILSFLKKKSNTIPDIIESFQGVCLVSSQECLLLRVNHPDAAGVRRELNCEKVQTQISSWGDDYSKRKKEKKKPSRLSRCSEPLWEAVIVCLQGAWMLYLGQLESRAETRCCPQAGDAQSFMLKAQYRLLATTVHVHCGFMMQPAVCVCVCLCVECVPLYVSHDNKNNRFPPKTHNYTRYVLLW